MCKEDSRRGVLLGLAWGDAFGCPIEMWRPGEIARVFGDYETLPPAYPRAILTVSEHRQRKLRPLGVYSDDTQQAMALIGCCLEEPGWDPRRWAAWLVTGNGMGAWRDFGRSFSEAVARLSDNVPVHHAGRFSPGIGAAMRTGPLGALYYDDSETLERVVCESSAVTHADVRAIASAYAVAHAVYLLLHGKTTTDVRRELPEATRRIESQWIEDSGPWRVGREDPHAVSDVLAAALSLRHADVESLGAAVERAGGARIVQKGDAHANQGQSVLGAVHAIATALYFDDDPQLCLSRLARQGYDTDTVAAIAGCLLGARHGTSWIPVAKLLDDTRLRAWADAIVVRETMPEARWEFFANERSQTELVEGYHASEELAAT